MDNSVTAICKKRKARQSNRWYFENDQRTTITDPALSDSQGRAQIYIQIYRGYNVDNLIFLIIPILYQHTQSGNGELMLTSTLLL